MNVWNQIADSFLLNQECITYGSINLEATWPVIYRIITQEFNNQKKIYTFDFGCGTGSLAEKLAQLGCIVTAYDTSEKMLEFAKNSSNNCVSYRKTLSSEIEKNNFHLITSIMVLQFIEGEELSRLLLKLCSMLKENGIFLFAVHNTDYISECLRYECKFRNLEKEFDPSSGEICLSGKWVPIHIRSAEWYEKILEKLGMRKMGSELRVCKPPFDAGTRTIKKWKSYKYYIAWYRKCEIGHEKNNS